MMRRVMLSAVVIAAWFAAGVLLDACRPIERPSGATSQAHGQNSAAKPVWIWSAARLYRLDTETEAVSDGTNEIMSEAVSTRDRRLQYFVTTETRAGKWELALEQIDVYGTSPVRSIPLMQVTATDRNAYEDVYAARPVLTADENFIYVAITEHRGKNWVTSLLRVDLANGTLGKPLPIFDAAAPWGANVNLALSQDEKKIYLVRTFDDKSGVESPIETRVAVVQTDALQIEKVIAVGAPILAESIWSDVLVAPNGQELYLLETVWKQEGNPGLRFVSIGIENGVVNLMTTIARETLDSGCDVRWRFVPNETDLWTWCATKIQYLDPGTGKITSELKLIQPLHFGGLAEYALSQDGKTLYAVFPMSREIVVADIPARKIVNETQLQDRAASPNFRRTLAGLLYYTAEAKMGGRPMVAMNPAETWLAFSEIQSFDSGDGVWVIDLKTMEPLGHWLRGQEISSVRASGDGKELYLYNLDVGRLQVLDPLTGSVLRSLEIPLADHVGMLADVHR